MIPNARTCPFCGSDDLVIRAVNDRDREGLPVAVHCVDCGTQGPWVYIQDGGHPDKAVDWWNQREDDE